MISLLGAGDTDVLRDAVRPSTIFWHRVRRATWIVAGAAAFTAIVALVFALLFLGQRVAAWITPERVAVVFSALIVAWLLYMGWALFKFLPGRNDRVVLGLRSVVRTRVDPLEERCKQLSDDALRAKRAELQERLARGETLDDIRPEAYACVREASRRARAHRQFECQLIGGKVIEDGNVAEMRTGEGKTIVCYMANYMKILQGLRVHMVTVNDYLVKRDAEFCRPIFELLGCTVGYISADMDTYGPGAEERRAAYKCDITYGTNSEFGFDHLRDNMKMRVSDQVQGVLDFAVVDEVDSILIDEARTPLIISGPAGDDVRNYQVADNVAQSLIRKQEQANRDTARRIEELAKNPPADVLRDPKTKAYFTDGINKFRKDPFWLSSNEAETIGHMQYFVVELDRKQAHMTEHGAKAAQAELGVGTFYDSKNMNWPHYIDNSLRAHKCYVRDKDFVVQDGLVIIVDEFTGRLMHGRQWSDGLHQAVEAKERVNIKKETQTLATVTLQNFFKLYKQLAGMTGTAMTEADEFMKIYRLEVIAIPTNKPIRRIDYNDKLYKSVASKFDAIIEEIRSYSQNGYPADPWSLYDMLREARSMLTAKRKADPQDAESREAIQRIDDAIRVFDEGQGDPGPLEQTYLALAGEIVGGRPLLVGTTSVENSEKLSQALTRRYGVEHEVLNAKNHAREAEIIAKAGQQHEQTRGKKTLLCGNVTIATNMAGRGTDIVLGPGVARIGGLHVLGSERHESRRIDNQLRGRCGRQGDPGSSRFFLSFEDDLIKLFMGEWMLKMLNRFGFEEGVPIEHKTMTRGIERAQKKVEERNFGIRKNLLEYDEVRDQQRKSFYELRQRVLEGRDLSGLIWDMIDESVADAVDRYYAPRFPAVCVVEWVAQNLGAHLDVGRLDTEAAEILFDQVRDQAAGDIRNTVTNTFGEYVDTSVPPDEWDLRGMIGWISQFGLNPTQRQIKEADPDELLEQIIEAATRRVEEADLAPLEPYLEPLYPKQRLTRWAHDKFGVEIPLDDLARAPHDEARRIIREKMREAYRRREIEYPVGAVINFALQVGGTNRNVVYDKLAQWANRKFGVGWTYEHFEGKNPEQLFRELRALNEDYLTNGKLDGEIDQALKLHKGDAILGWAQQRFGAVLQTHPVTPGPQAREQLQRCGYEMLRYELTQLERMVVLNTLDSLWKDHMYSMDLLREGIWLRGQAERDPKIEFKREGTRLFNEFMANIRERVTDLIFKVQLNAPPGLDDDGAGVGAPLEPPAGGGGGVIASHADATNVGFAAAAQDRDAAMQKQGEAGKPQTFRREEPKVGRNDPCPCGSGKKFKQCHGKRR